MAHATPHFMNGFCDCMCDECIAPPSPGRTYGACICPDCVHARYMMAEQALQNLAEIEHKASLAHIDDDDELPEPFEGWRSFDEPAGTPADESS